MTISSGKQIIQYQYSLELERILLEIGELVGIESPFDAKQVATCLYKEGLMTENEFRCILRNFYSFPLFFLH